MRWGWNGVRGSEGLVWSWIGVGGKQIDMFWYNAVLGFWKNESVEI